MVVNFNNKVIGVFAQEPEPSIYTGFIPCYPSSINDTLKKDIDYVFMTDLTIWNDYNETFRFLTKLYNKNKKRKDIESINCKPAFKIIEDELVVGILTETNQFVQLSEPMSPQDIISENDIPSIENDNYIVNGSKSKMVSIDVPTSTTNDVDTERVDYIKKIKMETNFYNIFRNTIRILLNDYDNIKLREQILNKLSNQYTIYSEKLKMVNKLLRELVGTKIQFIGDSNYYKVINEITTCIVKDKNKCSSVPNLCTVSDNGVCNLIIPQKNLITNKPNEVIYFGKMSDELIRYNRIKIFMFQQQNYISFGDISYNLRENEIIMLQSLLTQEYFENLIPMVVNKYVTHNSYDETNPAISQIYDNNVLPFEKTQENNIEIDMCYIAINNKITSSVWKSTFPNEYKERVYGTSYYCTFYFIIDLIESYTKEKYTVNQIKIELYNEYKKYLPLYSAKIIDILIIEGKKTLGEQVQDGLLTFNDFIFNDNYYLTTLDLWLLIDKYKIPSIFVSQKFILQTNYEKYCFVAHGSTSNNFAFIFIPAMRIEHVPSYKLVINTSDNNNIFISINDLNQSHIDNIMYAINNTITIEEYLRSFVKATKTNYIKKKPVNLIIKEKEPTKMKIRPIGKKQKQGNKLLLVGDDENNLAESNKQEQVQEQVIEENINNIISQENKKIEEAKEQTIKIIPKKGTKKIKNIEGSNIPQEQIIQEKEQTIKIIPKKRTRKVKLVLKGNKKIEDV
jgi:hypothetical protein